MITIPANRVLPLQAKAGGGYRSLGYVEPVVPDPDPVDPPPPATFTPMIAEDFESQALGQNYVPPTGGMMKPAYNPISNEQVRTGTKSLKIIAETYNGVTCGGIDDSWYGGRIDLPLLVTPGYQVWFMAEVYFPAGFSWGFVYEKDNATDDAHSTGCGLRSQDYDGNENGLKFMRFSKSGIGGRNYIYLPTQRRNIAQPNRTWGFMLNNEHSQFNEFIPKENGQIVPGTWQKVQFNIKVSTNGTGHLRAWLGSTFLGERTGIDTTQIAHGGIDELAFGTHFNGGHYSPDGSPEHKAFFVNEIIVASDIPGYGTPNTVDAGGRPFIHPDTTVGSFA